MPTTRDMIRTLRLHRSTWRAEGVVQLDLADPAGAELPEWRPGDHLLLHLPNGLDREYSLCGDPDDRHTLSVAVLDEPSSRGGSRYVHRDLPVGTRFEVSGPRNNFVLETAPEYLLVAGGIGITPIRAMAAELDRAGARFRLLYCGRSRASMAFLSDLEALLGDRLTVHADDEQGQMPDIPGALERFGDRGLVYCCGPAPLIDAVLDGAADPGQVRVERFRAPESPEPATPSEGFDVVCDRTGARVEVGPDESVLEALGSAGLDVPSSCQEGICGTCETRVLSGEVDHRDFLLSDSERADRMLVCVSRCEGGELVLDL